VNQYPHRNTHCGAAEKSCPGGLILKGLNYEREMAGCKNIHTFLESTKVVLVLEALAQGTNNSRGKLMQIVTCPAIGINCHVQKEAAFANVHARTSPQ